MNKISNISQDSKNISPQKDNNVFILLKKEPVETENLIGALEEEEYFKWFFRGISDSDPNQIIWKEYDESICEILEFKYQDFLFSMYDSNYQKVSLEEIGYEIDFLYQIQVSLKDKSKQREIGRFKGNPNIDKKLENTLISNKFRWYFLANDENSSEKVYAPYRIVDNDAIEKAFINYSLSKGPNYYEDKNLKIDFSIMEEIGKNLDGKKKKVFRVKECPKSMTRIDYYNNEIKPVKANNIILDENCISSIKSDYFLNLKNIFPLRCYSENIIYSFYYSKSDKSMILHLNSGWIYDDNESKTSDKNTQSLLEKLGSDYELLLKIKRDKDDIYFEEVEKIPVNTLEMIFKKKWYYRLENDNCYLWKQYSHEINSQIDIFYKNNYLHLGDKQNITISPNFVVNFDKSVQIVSDVTTPIMRFNIKNSFPDKVFSVKVPEEIFSAINLSNEKQNKIKNKPILYANKFGPSNINELICEIKNELKIEGEKLCLESEYLTLQSNYLDNISNFNFPSLIIKIYTEESFVYRRINKILRDHDIPLFLNLKYYYISLIYSLKRCNLNIKEKNIFRGMKLRIPELQEIYRNLEKDQMIQFDEFLSTTYDINIAKKYADTGSNSFLLEICIPENVIVSSIENYSRFEHEKEVLLPSGTILQFISKNMKNNLTVLSFKLINSNMEAFSHILSTMGTKIDLTNIDFFLVELQNLFNSLKKEKKITNLSLKVYNHLLIPYFAEYISKTENLNQITVYRDGDIISYRRIIDFVSKNRFIHINNFSIDDSQVFLYHFILHTHTDLKLINLYNFNDNTLKRSFKDCSELKLEKLKIENRDKSINKNILSIPYLLQSSKLCTTLLDLQLQEVYVSNESLESLISFLNKSISIANVNFCMNDCRSIDKIARIFKSNNSIKNLSISFNNPFKKTRKVIYNEENFTKKNITFNNIYESNFTLFLQIFLPTQNSIVHLNLSGNEFNKEKFFNLFIFILEQMKSLHNFDVSSNQICDSFITESYEYLKNNQNLKSINLENNLITEQVNITLRQINHFTILLDNQTISEKKIPNQLGNPHRYDMINVLSGHTDSVKSLINLYNGFLVSCSNDKTIRIWDPNNNYNCTHVLKDHTSSINILIKLSNGNFASASDDLTIKIWDTKKDYTCINTLKGHNRSIYTLIELSNGNIASGGLDNKIKIWDANNYDCIHTLKEHTEYVYTIIQLFNGHLASGSCDATIKIWDDNYNCINTLKGHKYLIIFLLQLSNGNIASCSLDPTIKIWDSKNNYNCIYTLNDHTNSVSYLVELSNQNIISCSFDNTIRIWESKNNYSSSRKISAHTNYVNSIIRLLNGNIVSCSKDYTIKIWNSDFNNECLQSLNGHSNSINSIIQISNGNIASCSEDKTIVIWDMVNKYTCQETLEAHKGYIYSLYQLSDENIASSSTDQMIKIWDAKNKYNCLHILKGHSSYVTSLIQLSNKNIASCSRDKSIKIWDYTRNYDCIYTLEHQNGVQSLIEMENGNIASGTEDYKIHIWNGSDKYQCLLILKGHTSCVKSLIQLNNGDIASGSFDKTIKIWDSTNNYNCIYNLKGHTNSINSIIKLYDGRIASASEDCSIIIWDSDNNFKCSQTLLGHKLSVSCLIQLSNGNIASSSIDNTIRIWSQKENYNCIFTLEVKYIIYTLVELSNGKIASGSNFGKIDIWEKPTYCLK